MIIQCSTLETNIGTLATVSVSIIDMIFQWFARYMGTAMSGCLYARNMGVTPSILSTFAFADSTAWHNSSDTASWCLLFSHVSHVTIIEWVYTLSMCTTFSLMYAIFSCNAWVLKYLCLLLVLDTAALILICNKPSHHINVGSGMQYIEYHLIAP